MPEKFDKHVLKNGMVLLGEPMEAVGSVAFGFMLPGGVALLPQGCCGTGNVITDWIFRGAGRKSSRELGDALDGLGLHRSSYAGTSHITLGAAMEADNLAEALELYADIILESSLKEDEFELAKQLAIDGVRALDDDPRQKVMLKLREQFYPEPLGRNVVGEIDDLQALTAEKTREITKNSFNLSETIFAVAGKYDFNEVCAELEELFDTAQPEFDSQVSTGSKGHSYTHYPYDGAQVHIGLMTETVAVPSDDYYNARVAASALSGGMSARLFTEVREKRGLCYAIGAQYHSLKTLAGIGCYAGTTPDKAQETLDVIMCEFARLCEGIDEDELQRAKVGLKSTLIMQSESSSARTGGIASDYYLLDRVRSLEEIKNKIEDISVESVNGFLNNNRFAEYTVATIGPKEITVAR